MNLKHLSTLTFAFIATACSAAAGTAAIEVADPDDFTDFSVSGQSPARTLPLFLSEFEDAASQYAERYLPEGYAVTLRFINVDMAGDIQPWRNPHNADIRYVEHIYPPRLEFDFVVTAADGTVAKQGTAKIHDLSFLFGTINPARYHENFYFESQLLRDWFRRELGTAFKDAS